MKYMNKIMLVVALVGLAGCDPTIKSTDVSMDPGALKNNAIVVSRVHAPYKSFWSDRPNDLVVNSYWRRLDGATGDARTRYVFGRQGFFAGFDTNGFHEHMIAPGKYRLEKLVYAIEGYKVTTIYTLEVEPQLTVEFEVKPGDAIYIGDIQVKTSSRSAKMVDNFPAALRWFQENHPEINKPLEKRLMTGMDGMDYFTLELLKKALDEVIREQKNSVGQKKDK